MFKPIQFQKDVRDYQKQFYEKNKESEKLRRKKYNEINKDKVKINWQNYKIANRDTINLKQREKRGLKSLYLEQLKYYNL